MARRSDHNREELYALAMNAARNIVAEEGFRALTARKVAERIGYSAGTLYNLFKNLDDMAVHLNADTLDLLRQDLEGIPLTGDPEADIHALLDHYLQFIAANERAWNMLFEHKLPEGVPVPDWYQEKVARVLGILENALEPLYSDPADPEKPLSARVLWSSLHGICQLAASNKLDIVSEENTRALAYALVENYLAGLQARQG